MAPGGMVPTGTSSDAPASAGLIGMVVPSAAVTRASATRRPCDGVSVTIGAPSVGAPSGTPASMTNGTRSSLAAASLAEVTVSDAPVVDAFETMSGCDGAVCVAPAESVSVATFCTCVDAVGSTVATSSTASGAASVLPAGSATVTVRPSAPHDSVTSPDGTGAAPHATIAPLTLMAPSLSAGSIGSTSVKGPGCGPDGVTVSVYVTESPIRAVVGLTRFCRSNGGACDCTVVVAAGDVTAGLLSGVTLATLLMAPSLAPESTRASMANEYVAMLASLPACTCSIVPFISCAKLPSGAVLPATRSAAEKVAPPMATSMSVVPVGMVSSTVNESSTYGPPLVVAIVQRRGSFGRAVAGPILATVMVGATTFADADDMGAGVQPPEQVALALLVIIAADDGAR